MDLRKIEELFTGKLCRRKDGSVVVAQISKKGKYYRYVMHPNRNKRSNSQKGNSYVFAKARAEADRQLKVRGTRLRWEVKFNASEGILNGKKHYTLRGYVLAACYQEEVKKGKEVEAGPG